MKIELVNGKVIVNDAVVYDGYATVASKCLKLLNTQKIQTIISRCDDLGLEYTYDYATNGIVIREGAEQAIALLRNVAVHVYQYGDTGLWVSTTALKVPSKYMADGIEHGYTEEEVIGYYLVGYEW